MKRLRLLASVLGYVAAILASIVALAESSALDALTQQSTARESLNGEAIVYLAQELGKCRTEAVLR